MILTTQNTGPLFRAQCVITGAANFTDATPNVTPPAAARIITTPAYMLAFNESVAVNLAARTSPALAAFLVDGTSASVRPWWYDDAVGTWFPGGDVVALTYASGAAASQMMNVRHTPGCRYFCQVTANVGVTKIAFLIR